MSKNIDHSSTQGLSGANPSQQNEWADPTFPTAYPASAPQGEETADYPRIPQAATASQTESPTPGPEMYNPYAGFGGPHEGGDVHHVLSAQGASPSGMAPSPAAPAAGAPAAGVPAAGFGGGNVPPLPPATAGKGGRGSRPKKQIGLATAVALMLGAAAIGGGVGGVVVSKVSPSTGTHGEAINTLDQPSIQHTSDREQGAIEKVAAAALPSVVSIRVVTDRGGDEGSGSIISSDGLVLTNHHVIAAAKDGGKITVTFHNGDSHPAEYVASDPSTDIGVIRIHDVSNLPVMKFGDSSQLAVGQQVVAIGSPLGLSSTVTTGIVSALDRPVKASQQGGEASLINAVQTDAAVNPGNSGGPLVDLNGNLVGVNSVIASLSRGEGTSGSIGLGFAIPANFAKRVAHQLIENGKAVQPLIGVKVRQDPRITGGLIGEVTPGGPAEKAGLRVGEIVTRVNGKPMDSADSLIATLRSKDFGETVTLTVEDPRTGDSREVEVTMTNE